MAYKLVMDAGTSTATVLAGDAIAPDMNIYLKIILPFATTILMRLIDKHFERKAKKKELDFKDNNRVNDFHEPNKL
jgi:hypothetical protein